MKFLEALAKGKLSNPGEESEKRITAERKIREARERAFAELQERAKRAAKSSAAAADPY